MGAAEWKTRKSFLLLLDKSCCSKVGTLQNPPEEETVLGFCFDLFSLDYIFGAEETTNFSEQQKKW